LVIGLDYEAKRAENGMKLIVNERASPPETDDAVVEPDPHGKALRAAANGKRRKPRFPTPSLRICWIPMPVVAPARRCVSPHRALRR